MVSSEMVIRSILGPVRRDIRPLVYAVDLTGQLLFERHIAMDDILVTKDIYPDVARQMGKQQKAISRRVERLTNYCWDKGDRDRLAQIIGRKLRFCPPPREMVIYLAFYTFLDVPFFTAIEQRPALLF